MRYFADISYLGTHFHGWQNQPNAQSVQSEIERCFSVLLDDKIEVVASGRTDSGVHAVQQIIHFDTEKNVLNADFLHKINSFLPLDVSVNNIKKVQPDAHARYSAISRTYHYKIHKNKNPFKNNISLYFNRDLNIKIMDECAQKLLIYHDFTSFSKLHSDNKHNLCKIIKLSWKENADEILFEIEANRFLRGMVRALVGTMIDVGLEKISVTEFENIIAKKDRKYASANAPAHGLFLKEIKYPETIYI